MIKHRIKCFDSEILVCENGTTTYDLSIQSLSNPLGRGKSLHTFLTEEQAMEGAEIFCKLYSAAREKGYYLKERFFTKPDKEKIEISELFASPAAVDQFFIQMEQ